MTWCDLEADRPWFDECAAADAEQDEQIRYDAHPPPAAAIAAERFGPLHALAAELDAPRPRWAAPVYVVRPVWMLDDVLTRYRRRRILNLALPPPRPARRAGVC